MPSCSWIPRARARTAHVSTSLPARVAASLAALLGAAHPDAHAEPPAREDGAASGEHGSAALSVGLDAPISATIGVGAAGGVRGSLQGEGWIGWTSSHGEDDAPAIWLLSAPQLDRRRGLLVTVDGVGLAGVRPAGEPGGRGAFVGELSESATLKLSPIVLEQRFSYQRPVEFSDRYWRPARDVTSVGGGFELPGFFSFEPYGITLIQLSLELDFLALGGRFAAQDARAHTAFIEHLGTAPGGPKRVAVIDAFVTDHAVPIERSPARWTALEAFDLRVDLASLAGLRLTESWSFGARGGIGGLAPAHIAVATSEPPPTDEGVQGPSLTMPTLFVDLVHQSSPRPFIPRWSALSSAYAGPTGPGAAVGAGTFQRLDPTGSAVDIGGQLSLEAGWELDPRWSTFVSGDVVVARRALVSDLGLPAGVAPRGAVLAMGRAEGGVSCRLTHHMLSRASVYAERSDRDDPVGLTAPASTAVRTRFGGALSLAATLRTVR